MYAVIHYYDSPRYGDIVSIHYTEADALDACDREREAVQARHPNAMTYLMYRVETLPTPAGDTGDVGDRICVDRRRR